MFFCVVGGLLDVIMYHMIKSFIDKDVEEIKEKSFFLQIQAQNKRDKILENDIAKAEMLKADILNNINVAEQFMRERASEKTFECLDELVNRFSIKESCCENRVLDAIITGKRTECQTVGVELKADLDLKNSLKIPNPELCIVVSNLLDNAIRACEKVTNKYISISAREKQGYLVIKQENSFDGVVENRRAGLLSEHGLGLGIIESLATKYDGSLKIETEEEPNGTHIFRTVVVLKNSN